VHQEQSDTKRNDGFLLSTVDTEAVVGDRRQHGRGCRPNETAEQAANRA
jgi:hypothetical protein